jgi:hypothetical protein
VTEQCVVAAIVFAEVMVGTLELLQKTERRSLSLAIASTRIGSAA